MWLKKIMTYALLSCIVFSSTDIAGAGGNAVERLERNEDAVERKVEISGALITNWLNARKEQYVQAGVDELTAMKLALDDFHDLKVRIDKGDQEVTRELLYFANTGKISLPLRPRREVDFATFKQNWILDRTYYYHAVKKYDASIAFAQAKKDFDDFMERLKKGDLKAKEELEKALRSQWATLKNIP